jgi:hypothetical protein
LAVVATACSSGGGERATREPIPTGPAPAVSKQKPEPSGRFWLSADDILRMRQNAVNTRWGRIAWLKTVSLARDAMHASPRPASPAGPYTGEPDRDCKTTHDGWYCGLYIPGLRDGRYAYSLALAYAITGKERFAAKAREYLLAWARTYNPPPPTSEVGHAVAEPVGFMLKAFFAYDLIRDTFSPDENRTFRDWAAQFVERGEREADHAMDDPWIPQAPWGNSATWARSLAVAAAAVVGGDTLREALDWNWEHTTEGGHDYGWIELLRGVMQPSGRMIEEDVRSSVDYALYTWHPLALIAAIADVTGYEHDLWTAEAPSGQTLRRPIEYYAPYLTKQENDPYEYDQDHLDTLLGEYRAAMETAGRRFPDWTLLREIVHYGGDAQRGLNEDVHITGWNALAGAVP